MARGKCRVRGRYEALFELCDALLLENNGRDSQQKRRNNEYPRKNFILFLCEQHPPPIPHSILPHARQHCFQSHIDYETQTNIPKFFVQWATDFSFYTLCTIGSIPSSFVSRDCLRLYCTGTDFES